MLYYKGTMMMGSKKDAEAVADILTRLDPCAAVEGFFRLSPGEARYPAWVNFDFFFGGADFEDRDIEADVLPYVTPYLIGGVFARVSDDLDGQEIERFRFDEEKKVWRRRKAVLFFSAEDVLSSRECEYLMHRLSSDDTEGMGRKIAGRLSGRDEEVLIKSASPDKP